MATIRRLYKQGNSVVLSVPGWMLESNGLKVGDEVMMYSSSQDGVIGFRKWNPPEEEEDYSLAEAERKGLRG